MWQKLILKGPNRNKYIWLAWHLESIERASLNMDSVNKNASMDT